MKNTEQDTQRTASFWSKHSPNLLTLLRLFAVPVFVFLLVDPTPTSGLWATFIFIGASLTDWLDGYLARLYHAESILGKLLDPLADKILTMAALVMLAGAGAERSIPAWSVVALLSRDMLVSGLRSLAAVKGTIVEASRFAKHKTAWMMTAIICLLISDRHSFFGLDIDFHHAGMTFLWISLFFSVTTGIHYAVTLRKVFEQA